MVGPRQDETATVKPPEPPHHHHLMPPTNKERGRVTRCLNDKMAVGTGGREVNAKLRTASTMQQPYYCKLTMPTPVFEGSQ